MHIQERENHDQSLQQLYYTESLCNAVRGPSLLQKKKKKLEIEIDKVIDDWIAQYRAQFRSNNH